MLRELMLQSCTTAQGRNEVRWRPGQEASLAPPCSNLSSFESKFIALKKVLVTFVGLFGAPAMISRPVLTRRPGNCAPFAPPCYAPATTTWSIKERNNNSVGGSWTKLALEMIRPRVETRLVKPTLLVGVKEVVKIRFPQLAIVSRPPGPWASEGFFQGEH